MSNPTFQSRLHNLDVLIGTIISLPSPAIAEIMAEAGFNWLFVDLEHSPLDITDAQAILQAVAGRVDCILRLPRNDEVWIKKSLDTGCAGIMIPQVNSGEDAQRAVAYSKYPPQGSRSVGISRAQGYGARFQEYVGSANREVALIVQIEHQKAVENIENILSVAGIDAVFLGPYDLSASMNLTGQVDHPDVQAALTRVRQICLERTIPCGIFTLAPDKVPVCRAEGYSLIALSGDAILLAETSRAAVRAARK